MGTTGKPKLPAIHRLRTDISWEEVVAHWKGRKAKPNGKRIIPLPTLLNHIHYTPSIICTKKSFFTQAAGLLAEHRQPKGSAQ